MRTADFDFELPPELIAQHPAPKRDASRLLVLHRDGNRIEHKRFPDLADILQPGDVLVLNNSRVVPARLRGVNSKSGGKFEVLLLEENGQNDWWVMLRPGRQARVGTKINFCNPDGNATDVHAEVIATNDEGHRRLHFFGAADIGRELERLGEVPLPPYIERPIPDTGGQGTLSNGICPGRRFSGRADGGSAFHAGIAGTNPRARRAKFASSLCTSAPARFCP